MIRLIIYCLLCLSITGCISTKYVEQKQYLLNIRALPENNYKNKATKNKHFISVEPITAIAPFDQLDFLYRINSGQYLTDYYHGFLAPPTEQLEPMLTNYLKTLGNFSLDAAAQNKLQVQITEFYADYRDRSSPRAVIALRFILNKSADNKYIVLFDKVLYAKVAIKEKNTASLLSAWNEGLQDVVTCGVKALNTVLSKN